MKLPPLDNFDKFDLFGTISHEHLCCTFRIATCTDELTKIAAGFYGSLRFGGPSQAGHHHARRPLFNKLQRKWCPDLMLVFTARTATMSRRHETLAFDTLLSDILLVICNRGLHLESNITTRARGMGIPGRAFRRRLGVQCCTI